MVRKKLSFTRFYFNPPDEDKEQSWLADWLTLKNILFYHIPNGGLRDKREAAKFKRLGVKRGVPDLCIPISNGRYHGLYIELKRASGGSMTKDQKKWQEDLNKNGYLCVTCNGWIVASQVIQSYFGIGI